jgi:hypothetical protein
MSVQQVGLLRFALCPKSFPVPVLMPQATGDNTGGLCLHKRGYAFSYGNSLPHLKPLVADLAYQRSQDRVRPAPTNHRREKMRQLHRHIDDPVTSVISLLLTAVLGFLGLLVLMLTLALGI